MTPNKEDYLKNIYKLGGYEKYISNKELSQSLEISPASISEMVLRLEKESLVEYVPYHGVKLTDEGIEKAIYMIRAHRLWEVFLMEKLNYDWADIHEDAELLEHASSERLLDKLDEFLSYPENCPHGSTIPTKQNLNPDKNLILLSDIPEGESCFIMEVKQDEKLLSYLEKNKIHLRNRIDVLENNEYEELMKIKIEKKEFDFTYKISNQIHVKKQN